MGARKDEPSRTNGAIGGVDSDPGHASPIDPAEGPSEFHFSGWFKIPLTAGARMSALVRRHPELDLLLRPKRGRVTLSQRRVQLTPAQWGRVYRGLMLCAALATEGQMRITCDAWDTCINAVAGPRDAPGGRRARPPTTRTRERPRRRRSR